MKSRKTIGFDRRLDLQWLDASAARAAAGDDLPTARAYLERVLTGVVDGEGKRGSRAKTVTVLLGVWHRVPIHARAARDRLLPVLTEGTPADRLGAHWAMCMLSYPFYADVAAIVGRLLALQGNLTWGQARRRVWEKWGERQTAERAANRIVRSWNQWGVLADAGRPGAYRLARTALPISTAVAEALAEAVLRQDRRDAVPSQDLITAPNIFPFQLAPLVPALRKSDVFEFLRHGDGESLALASTSAK